MYFFYVISFLNQLRKWNEERNHQQFLEYLPLRIIESLNRIIIIIHILKYIIYIIIYNKKDLLNSKIIFFNNISFKKRFGIK